MDVSSKSPSYWKLKVTLRCLQLQVLLPPINFLSAIWFDAFVHVLICARDACSYVIFTKNERKKNNNKKKLQQMLHSAKNVHISILSDLIVTESLQNNFYYVASGFSGFRNHDL